MLHTKNAFNNKISHHSLCVLLEYFILPIMNHYCGSTMLTHVVCPKVIFKSELLKYFYCYIYATQSSPHIKKEKLCESRPMIVSHEAKKKKQYAMTESNLQGALIQSYNFLHGSHLFSLLLSLGASVNPWDLYFQIFILYITLFA